MGEKSRKILFTTIPSNELISKEGLRKRYINHNDLQQNMTYMAPKILQLKSFVPSNGLHFLKKNFPDDVVVLEYPTWDQYYKEIEKKYEIIGISFHTYTASSAIKMAKIAKAKGTMETWAGNYGAMTPGIEEYFDKIFIGTFEERLSNILGKQLPFIRHPELYTYHTISGLRSFVKRKVGLIFSSRGCSMDCNFCPTPHFEPKVSYIEMDELKRILDIYYLNNISHLHITDETFLYNKKHSEQLIQETVKRGLPWSFLTRADLVRGKIKEFKKQGMMWVGIGIESLNDKNLEKQNKGESLDVLMEVIDEAKINDLPLWGTYMIGYEDDTFESVREEIEKLRKLNLLSIQFAVFTPFPGTKLWDQLKNKIFDYDWDHYDHMQLVWRHPKIEPQKMLELFDLAHKRVNRPSNYLLKLLKLPHPKKVNYQPPSRKS